MPANKKYLTKSKSQRFAKVSASILGGFLVSSTFHIAIASLLADRKNLWATYTFSLFVLWCGLMLLPFFFKNGWKCWALYGGFIAVFGSVICFGLFIRPIL